LKKALVLLIGSAMLLCAGPASADQKVVNIPYVQHGDGWWCGLALSNMGPDEITLFIYTTHTGEERLVGQVSLSPFSQDVRLLSEFFTGSSYPTANNGRVSLRIFANCASPIFDNLGATLFMGNSEGGFGFYNTTINDYISPC
jgi:hypothetical protein